MKIIGKHIITGILCLLTTPFTFAQNTIDQVDTSYEGVSKLVVKGGFCDVNIVGGGENQVALNGKISGTSNNGEIKIMHRQSGSTLEVWIDRPSGNNWNWGINNLNGKLNFRVPARLEVIVTNSSGDIDVKNIEYSVCELGTSSGDIRAESINANLKITATSGDISATQVKGNLKGRTSSGSQKLTNIVGEIETEASSGDIRINTSEGDIEAQTTSGSIDIESAKGVFDLKTTSGGIDGNAVIVMGNSSFKSTSGNIDIQLKNDMKTISFDLQASSGNLRAGQIRADRKLYMKNGSGGIEIRGVSSSGNQSYTD
jgi:DUF4097 and DUF4098 domain-containing protein YvlB